MYRLQALVVVFCASSVALAGAARKQDEKAQLQALVAKQSPALVTVKAVLKVEAKGADSDASESRMSLGGVVVDPSGLIMTSNTPFSPMRLMQMMGRSDSNADSIKMRPTSLKVLLQGDDTEYNAFLAATDSKLDLAFIQMEGLNGRKLTAVDFSTSVEPAVGQTVAAVMRMSKGYDYAPYFRTARVCGEVQKPRRAWMLEGGSGEIGLPIFAESGEPIGVLTMLPSGVHDADDDTRSFGMAMRMITGGGGMEGVFVVPGATVKAIVDQAARRAADLAVERAKQPPAAAPAGRPSPPPRPAPSKPAPPKPPARK